MGQRWIGQYHSLWKACSEAGYDGCISQVAWRVTGGKSGMYDGLHHQVYALFCSQSLRAVPKQKLWYNATVCFLHCTCKLIRVTGEMMNFLSLLRKLVCLLGCRINVDGLRQIIGKINAKELEALNYFHFRTIDWLGDVLHHSCTSCSQ